MPRVDHSSVCFSGGEVNLSEEDVDSRRENRGPLQGKVHLVLKGMFGWSPSILVSRPFKVVELVSAVSVCCPVLLLAVADLH